MEANPDWPSLSPPLSSFYISFTSSFTLKTAIKLKKYITAKRRIKQSPFFITQPLLHYFPQGENLNLASDESDVNVTIGTKQCNVTSLALTQLVCTPPELQPPPTDELGRSTEVDLPLVVVRMGQNLRFPIGYLRYEMIKVWDPFVSCLYVCPCVSLCLSSLTLRTR